MTGAPQRITFRDLVRSYLGTDNIHDITDDLTRIEANMAKVIDLLNGLVQQQADASAAQTTSFHNIDLAFQKLQDAINAGDVSPDVQTAVDQLSAGFTSLQKAAEDEGNLYQPPTDTPPPSTDTPPSDVPPATDTPPSA